MSVSSERVSYAPRGWFVRRLFNIIEDRKSDAFIRWFSRGGGKTHERDDDNAHSDSEIPAHAFVIADREQFEKHVLPQLTSSGSLSTFLRQYVGEVYAITFSSLH